MKSPYIISISILALLGVAACTDSLQQNPDGRFHLNIAADMCNTKVSLLEKSDGIYQSLWTDNEDVKVILKYGSGVEVVDGSLSTVDHFWANISAVHNPYPESQSFTYYSVIPSSNFVSASEDGNVVISVPQEQSPTLACFDASASVIVGSSETFSSQQGGTAENPESIDMSFRFATAMGKFSLSGCPEDETLLQVNLVAENKVLSGKINVKPDGSFTVAEAQNSITVNLISTDKIWFASLPAELDEWAVQLVTSKGMYTQKISRKLSLVAGAVAEFSVNMTGAEFSTVDIVKYSRTLTPGTDMDNIIMDSGVNLEGWLVKGIWCWSPRGVTYVFDDVPASGEYRVSIFTYYWVKEEDSSIGVAINVPSPVESDYVTYPVYKSDRNADGNYTVVIDNVAMGKGRNTIKISKGDYLGSNADKYPFSPNIGPVTVSNEHLFQDTEQTSN